VRGAQVQVVQVYGVHGVLVQGGQVQCDQAQAVRLQVLQGPRLAGVRQSPWPGESAGAEPVPLRSEPQLVLPERLSVPPPGPTETDQGRLQEKAPVVQVVQVVVQVVQVQRGPCDQSAPYQRPPSH
jgi:hypothetical protein